MATKTKATKKAAKKTAAFKDIKSLTPEALGEFLEEVIGQHVYKGSPAEIAAWAKVLAYSTWDVLDSLYDDFEQPVDSEALDAAHDDLQECDEVRLLAEVFSTLEIDCHDALRWRQAQESGEGGKQNG